MNARRAITAAAAATVSASLGFSSQAAAAPAVSGLQAPARAAAGQPFAASFDVAAANGCTVTLSGPSGSAAVHVPAAQARVTVTGRLSAAARPGAYRLAAACGPARIIRTIRVISRRSGSAHAASRLLAAPLRAAAASTAPAAAGARPSTDWTRLGLDAAQAGQLDGIITRMSDAVTASGECTALIMQRRPEIFAASEGPLLARQLAAGAAVLQPRNWDARNVAGYAAQAGFTVTALPQPGAVMAAQPGVLGAGQYGHVAIVTSVSRDGSFTVAEMNWDAGPGRISQRRIPAGVRAGLQFVL